MKFGPMMFPAYSDADGRAQQIH